MEPSLPSPAAAFLDSLDLDSVQQRVATLRTPLGTYNAGISGGDTPLPSAPKEELKPPAGSPSVSLLYVCHSAGVDVCGGRIGVDKVKFCSTVCAPQSTTCGKHQSHTRKAELLFPAYYITVPNQPHAYLSPCLIEPPGGFSKAVLTSVNGIRPVSEWIDIFTALNGVELLTESEQVDIMSRFDNMEYSLKIAPTPMRFRQSKRVSDDIFKERSEFDEIGVGEESTGSWSFGSFKQPQLLEDAMEGEGAIGHMVSNWDGLVRATQRQRQATEHLETDMRSLLEKVDNKVVKVAAMVGDTIGAHSDALESHMQVWKNGRAQLDAGVKEVHDDVAMLKHVISNKIVGIINVLTANVEHLQHSSGNTMGTQHLSTNSPPSAAEFATLQNEMMMMYQRMNAMADELKILKEGGSAQPMRNVRNVLGQNETVDDEFNLRLEVGVLKDELRLVQHDLVKLRSESNSDIVEFGGFTFHASDTYILWVTQHVKSGYYGFCYDFVSLLESHSTTNRLASQGIKTKESVTKAGYADSKLAIIDQSFGCTFPEVFGDEFDAANPAKKFGKLKTVVEWDNPSAHSGLKHKIDTFLHAFQKNVEGQITSTFGWNSTSGLFFTHMMQQNIKFWDTMSQWITKFERDLTHRSGGDDKSVHEAAVWELICLMIHAMFVEMNVRRSPGTGMVAISGDDGDTSLHKCAIILQGTLAAHQFMAELVKADFIRHPIFSATMDEFLLKNKAAHATVENLASKFKKMESEVKSAQAAADRAYGAMKGAGGNGGRGAGRGGRGGGANAGGNDGRGEA
jgi:hypothetical protein